MILYDIFFLRKEYINLILFYYKLKNKRNEEWNRMNYLGWRFCKALGYKCIKKYWLILVIIILPNEKNKLYFYFYIGFFLQII